MLKKIFLALIDVYQEYINLLLPHCCRFSPSCSQYTREAVLKYGFWRGLIKGAKRLLCCQPYCGKSGYDPLI